MNQPANHRPNLTDAPPNFATFAGLWFCLAFPSCGIVQKYFGNIGVLIYLIATAGLLWLVCKYASRFYLARISEGQALFLAAATLLGLVLIFAFVYPKANVHLPGKGSDADDALNLAVNELLHGRYPYYARTYLDNPVANLPGTIFLAVPFALLGNSAYQNFFWLMVFFIAVSLSVRSWRLGLMFFWVILIFSPVVMYYLVTGGDDPANAIYVLVFLLWLVHCVHVDARQWQTAMVAALLGVGLSSRTNFLLVMPQLFSVLAIKAGWRIALKYVVLAAVCCAALTLPFWIHDPAGFSPLRAQAGKITQFQNVVPFAGLLVPLMGGCLALALAWRSLTRRRETWLRDGAIVQAFLVISLVTLSAIRERTLSLVLTGYGVFFLFFGVLAFAERCANHSTVTQPD